ncbi:MAG: 50S ribosomal protein L4 [Gammaproteobacteria bacterium RIFCSPHIGHO2_12_FULL_45_12]|nr:MAG: 50S ribosomal protein L4 [Gammaproteobacteria bacterium RIFCSPHIGHO2_12_FULL_45_12]
MELKLSDSKKKLEVADDVFACEFNESLIHQIVTAYMAGARAGTKSQKTRAEVSGGGAKPFKQKGTGRARAGTIRSPIWRTGGVTFAAKPRSFKQKVNKKMYKGAIRSIFSELIRQERLMLVDTFQIASGKTKELVKKLQEMKVEGQVLIVSDSIDESLYLASRNLFNVDVRDTISSATDPVSLVRAEKIIVTQAAMKEIEGLLQ